MGHGTQMENCALTPEQQSLHSKQSPGGRSGFVVVDVLFLPRIITFPTVGTSAHTVAIVLVVIGVVAISHLAAMNICLCSGVGAATADGPAGSCRAPPAPLLSCPFACCPDEVLAFVVHSIPHLSRDPIAASAMFRLGAPLEARLAGARQRRRWRWRPASISLFDTATVILLAVVATFASSFAVILVTA